MAWWIVKKDNAR